jgi:hypothetical protein
MYKLNFLAILLFISLIFMNSSLHAQGPVIKDGKWEAVFSDEMNTALDEQIKMLDALAKTEPSIQRLKENMMKSLEEARKPRSYNISEEEAERGVISIFEQSDKITRNSGITNAGCTHEIDWLEKRIGTVSGKCEDGSIIKGEVSVPSDIEIHYKGTVTPANDNPYPVGWDAKWITSYKKDTEDIY